MAHHAGVARAPGVARRDRRQRLALLAVAAGTVLAADDVVGDLRRAAGKSDVAAPADVVRAPLVAQRHWPHAEAGVAGETVVPSLRDVGDVRCARDWGRRGGG